jgi:transposase
VEQFEGIRRDSRDRAMSIRALARRHGVHRRTVRQALADAMPPARRLPERSAPATGPYVDLVRRWLIEDQAAPRKQRHTARRIWQRLVEEEDARIGESTVRNLVARLRTEIGADHCQVMVPQTHPPAAEAEVDFGEFTASIAGQVMKLYMFCMRLSHSGKAFHFGYANQTQESFLDGHVRAFEAFGGVPTGMIRYDNLKPAVIRIALGRERFEHPRFVAMRSHYGYDSFFCAPGVDGAHEKGGVEGEIGRFRRRHLTPMPQVGSLEVLNAALAAADARDDTRRISGRVETIGEAAARELRLLMPLPAEPFDVSLRLSCRVDAKARICVRQSYYSVPARYAGRRLEVRLGATSLTVYDAATILAEHSRSLHKYSQDLVLDHYLEVLSRKPGAFSGSTALAAARASGVFTGDHQRFWETARRRLGDGPGTRALIGVLLLHRTLHAKAVITGINAALSLDSVDPDLVAVEARRASRPEPMPPLIMPPTQSVPDRPTPSLASYDQLLAGALR